MFRSVALEKLSSPERLDVLPRVTDPRGWIALAALAGLVVALLAWSILGVVPVWVNGRGMLLTPSGVMEVVALESGLVVAQLVQPGDTIAEGQPIARMLTPGGEPRDVVAVTPGRVLELRAYRGDFVAPGAPLLTLQATDEELGAVIYVPATSGGQVAPGMTVHLGPATVRSEEYGFLLGAVRRVTEFPATAQGISALLNDPGLAAGFLSHGPVYEVRVDLVRDPRTPSGYQWTSVEGPPLSLAAGTFLDGSVIVDRQRPIGFLFPAAR
jgi:hypothetical protein